MGAGSRNELIVLVSVKLGVKGAIKSGKSVPVDLGKMVGNFDISGG